MIKNTFFALHISPTDKLNIRHRQDICTGRYQQEWWIIDYRLRFMQIQRVSFYRVENTTNGNWENLYIRYKSAFVHMLFFDIFSERWDYESVKIIY